MRGNAPLEMFPLSPVLAIFCSMRMPDVSSRRRRRWAMIGGSPPTSGMRASNRWIIVPASASGRPGVGDNRLQLEIRLRRTLYVPQVDRHQSGHRPAVSIKRGEPCSMSCSPLQATSASPIASCISRWLRSAPNARRPGPLWDARPNSDNLPRLSPAGSLLGASATTYRACFPRLAGRAQHRHGCSAGSLIDAQTGYFALRYVRRSELLASACLAFAAIFSAFTLSAITLASSRHDRASAVRLRAKLSNPSATSARARCPGISMFRQRRIASSK